ncbi:hypothetical protein E8E11_004047 [Didymella keratinophila]|nr:hypothetical protein E8E11_004047 [Didymella keratinophila]
MSDQPIALRELGGAAAMVVTGAGAVWMAWNVDTDYYAEQERQKTAGEESDSRGTEVKNSARDAGGEPAEREA